MNKANQQQVVQTANMTVVAIRQAEIAYFSTFFSNFGTQCALIIGFICGSISQVPGVQNPSNCAYGWIVMYWVTTAMTVAAAVHVLVCTVFLSVFGQGLALRGPLGSMAIGMYWIMMDSTSAIASTIITLFGMILWYRHTLRIYNRFNWNKLKADYYNEQNPEDEINELDPNLPLDKARALAKRGTDGSGGNLKTPLMAGKKKKSLFSFMSSSNEEFAAPSSASQSPMDRSHSTERNVPFYEMSVPGRDSVLGEEVKSGFITILSANRKLIGDPWERRFMVVRGTLLFYYKDKRSFELFPGKPINQRPIDMDGYTLVGGGSSEMAFTITLTPIDPEDIRKVWKFRCDTAAEFNTWLEIFQLALKACPNSYSQSDLVKIPAGSVVGGLGGNQVDDDSVEE